MEKTSGIKMPYVYFGVFFISMGIILLELVITRIFSVVMYYHFAFLAISLALLGLGVGGIWVYLFNKRFTKEKAHKQLTIYSILFALSLFLMIFVFLKLKWDLFINLKTFLRTFLANLLVFIPFLFGGLSISIALTHFSDNVSKLYFFDLIGAGLGAMLVVLLLNTLGGPASVLIVAVAALLGALFFSLNLQNKKYSILSIVLIVLSIIILIVGQIGDFYKFDYVKGRLEDSGNFNVFFSDWNSFSRVAVVGPDEPDGGRIIEIDAEANTAIVQWGKVDPESYETSASSYPHHIKKSDDVLIIGPGGGVDIATAKHFGSEYILGVDINPIIVNDIMKGEFKEYSGGIYELPGVETVAAEGRNYLRGLPRTFDLIQIPLTDTFAATSAGAFILTENNLYTVEAFDEYIGHLNDDGILSIIRFIFSNKPQEMLKLTTIGFESMKQLGIENPEEHIMVVAFLKETKGRLLTKQGSGNFMLKKSPFTEDEITKMEEACDKVNCRILYAPNRDYNNEIFTDYVSSENKEDFFKSYEFDVAPSTDNKPFFFYMTKFKDIPEVFNITDESLKIMIGLFFLLVAFLVSLVLVLAFIIIPLLFIAKKGLKEKGSLRRLLYFVGLGVGFIMVEIALMQKFILFLGHPVYALAVVLFSLLIFSGIGAYITNKVNGDFRKMASAITFIVAFLAAVGSFFLLPYIFETAIGLDIATRILISILFIAPLGIFMGMPFPLGIKIINHENLGIVPWAWGINGATSVFGSIASILLAINFGFNLVLGIGVMAYLFSMLIIRTNIKS